MIQSRETLQSSSIALEEIEPSPPSTLNIVLNFLAPLQF